VGDDAQAQPEVEKKEAEPLHPADEGDKRSWAVKLGTYADVTVVRSAAASARNKHPAFASLRLAYVPEKTGTGAALAFGPIDHQKAKDICTSLRQQGQNCTMVRLGERS